MHNMGQGSRYCTMGPTASIRSGERRGFCSRTASRSPNIESSSRAKIFARSQKKSLPAVGSSRLESCGVGHRFVTDSFHGLFASHRSHLNRTVRIANFAPMPLCLIQASSCSALITNKYFSFHWQAVFLSRESTSGMVLGQTRPRRIATLPTILRKSDFTLTMISIFAVGEFRADVCSR
jgi:hypothetical protein